jgi:hypothetical protein
MSEKMSSIQTALEKLQKLGEKRQSPLPPPTQSNLTDAEKQLGIIFPPSYQIFLEKGGAYGLHFEELLWIGADPELVATNLAERNGTLPDCLVSFLSDGYGTQVCFDTRKISPNGEYPIVEWERGMQKEDLFEDELEPVAHDFPSWLIEHLEREQEEL